MSQHASSNVALCVRLGSGRGVLAALERGTLPDWHRLVVSIDASPWGIVARQAEEALELPYGVAPRSAGAITDAARGTERPAPSCSATARAS